MQVFRTRPYLRALRRLGMDEAAARAVEDSIVANPRAGAVIRGLGGVRKARFALAGRGKRGGGRAVYYVLWEDDELYMLTVYAKADKDDLSAADRKVIRQLLRDLGS